MPRKKVDASSLQRKHVFTTGEVATILGVSNMTVVKWFDAGKIQGYRVPQSRDRRISRESLIEFIHQNGIEVDALVQLSRRILVVDDDRLVRSAVELAFEDDSDITIEVASTGYEAGLKMGRNEPAVIILDIMLGDIDARDLVRRIRADRNFVNTKILGISAYFKAADVNALRSLGFDDFLPKPFQAEDLRKKVLALVETASRTPSA